MFGSGLPTYGVPGPQRLFLNPPRFEMKWLMARRMAQAMRARASSSRTSAMGIWMSESMS